MDRHQFIVVMFAAVFGGLGAGFGVEQQGALAAVLAGGVFGGLGTVVGLVLVDVMKRGLR